MVIPSGPLEAMAVIQGQGGLRGMVKFYPVPSGTLVAAEVSGLPAEGSEFFALHIQGGTDRGRGEHGNRAGCLVREGRIHPGHIGMLPVMAAGGRAMLAVETDRFFWEDVIGRTVAVYPWGNTPGPWSAGCLEQKIGSGTIERVP